MRNRIGKTILSFLLAAFTFLGSASVCLAVEPLELHMEGVVAADGELLIYCNTNTEQPPSKDEFSVTLGNETLPVKNTATLEDTDQGVSYIFLVDASGSIGEAHFQAIKDTLTVIGGKLGENDNISVIDIGNETYTQPFVSGSENIQAQIGTIETRGENTNLYESVTTSLAIFQTNENCHDKKVLIIFSDGEEYSFRGITIDEAAIEIEAAHIPIYTVAMLGQNPPTQYVETAKILGSFARLSAGGRHYIHTLDRDTTETITNDIVASIQRGMIVSADLSDFHSDGNDMNLRLELTVSGMGKADDGYAISTAGLSAAPVESSEPEPSSSSEPSSSLEPSSSPESSSSSEPPPEPVSNNDDQPEPPPSNRLIWIIGGVVGILLAGTVILILLRRKKSAVSSASIVDEPISQARPVRPAVPPPPPGKPRIALRLTKIGLNEEDIYRAEFAGQLIIGRDSSKAFLAFPKDDLLSATHCSIRYEPEGIVLEDLRSTNGTFVNGVPVRERYILESDDILLIGSMELRVNWEPLGSV
jgi:hypothetical protein